MPTFDQHRVTPAFGYDPLLGYDDPLVDQLPEKPASTARRLTLVRNADENSDTTGPTRSGQQASERPRHAEWKAIAWALSATPTTPAPMSTRL